MGKHKTPRFLLTLPEPLKKRLQAQAAQENKSLSDLIRERLEMSMSNWYVEFGPQVPGRNRQSFGPFPSEEKAREQVRQIREDNPKNDPFASGYQIITRPETGE